MTQMESKIKAIEARDPVTFKDGNKMDKMYVDLENGDQGEALVKDASSFKAGDEVTYEKVTDQWGTKLKPFKKKGAFGGKSFTPKDESAAARAQAPGVALQAALESYKLTMTPLESKGLLALASKYNAWLCETIDSNKK